MTIKIDEQRGERGWTLIYRVEHVERSSGPYFVEDFTAIHGEQTEEWWLTHPKSKDDGIGFCLKSMCFGFRDMGQLRNWFDAKSRERLHALGYGIAVYEVHSCNLVIGKRQVAFQRNAVRPRTVPDDYTPLVGWMDLRD